MSFSVRKTFFRFSLTRSKTSPNSGIRWWMIGNAPAAETSGGMGVGPGDIRRYLCIMGRGIPLLPRTTHAYSIHNQRERLHDGAANFQSVAFGLAGTPGFGGRPA